MSQQIAPGCYRRRIDLRAQDATTAVGWLEDDYHHFGVTIVHDGVTVQAVRAASPRYPWTTCPGALEPIRALQGKPLVRRCADIGGLINMRAQCTHLFDLAGLTLAHAANARSHRRYEVVIPDRPVVAWDDEGRFAREFGPTRATLLRDEVEVMAWDIQGEGIAGPSAYAGQSLQKGFREWTEAMPQEEAEYATILRRAIMVGSGRLVSMGTVQSADAMTMGAVCFTFQPERRAQAHFVQGSRLDFAARRDDLLQNMGSGP